MDGLYNHKNIKQATEIRPMTAMPSPNLTDGSEVVSIVKYEPIKNLIDGYIGEIGKSQLKQNYDSVINNVYESLDKVVSQPKEKIGFDSALKLFEKSYLSNALQKASNEVLDGVVNKAAEYIGIDRSTLSRKISDYNISDEIVNKTDSSKTIQGALENAIFSSKDVLPESMYNGLKDSIEEIARKSSYELNPLDVASTTEEVINAIANELSTLTHKEAMDEFKALYTGFALQRFYGDKNKVAEDLGISPKTVDRRIKNQNVSDIVNKILHRKTDSKLEDLAA